MWPYLLEPRSKNWYDDDEPAPSSGGLSEILLFPLGLLAGIALIYIVPILLVLCLIGYSLNRLFRFIKPKIASLKFPPVLVGTLLVLAALLMIWIGLRSGAPAQMASQASGNSANTVSILVDDFNPQPYAGNEIYYYNRLEGDRGALNDSLLNWGKGKVAVEISSGRTWGGIWMSLDHPIREGQGIDFSAVLPQPILPAYQSLVTGITVLIERGTPGKTFRVELKDGDAMRWKAETALNGGQQTISYALPALRRLNQIVLVLDNASGGDEVILQRVSLTATNPIADPAMVGFVWSYAMLLDNWNPDTGLVRDKAKDASGEFDAIQSTGSLAGATAQAEQLGVISHASAVRIVEKIKDTLVNHLPRYHGLWPHWVRVSPNGSMAIVANTEWSSVDTVIAAIGLLDAQSALGMDTSGPEHILQSIDWQDLRTPGGISHGYSFSGEQFSYAWDTFGGESWLVELAYAAATGKVAPLAYPSPPTANGSGFIDELAWLFLPPPSRPDYWGVDWASYRQNAASKQIQYYPNHDPSSCFTQLGLFGLSAGEQPDPSRVPLQNIYQAFGVGGRFSLSAEDGLVAQGAPVVTPHYSAMIASLYPQEATRMWDWLIHNGLISPLNNVESLSFPTSLNCEPGTTVWNQLKGSWNLSLQTLGWGRYLASRDGKDPILWRAATTNTFLHNGYLLLAPDNPIGSRVPTSTAAPTQDPGQIVRECENPDEATVGQAISRSNASGQMVYGQFGTTAGSPWPAKPGYVTYTNIHISSTGSYDLTLRYSKYSPASVPILVYLDGEAEPRAKIAPSDQGSWDAFAWTEPISLGEISAGVHSIRFATDGQQYGVADLDIFVLSMGKP